MRKNQPFVFVAKEELNTRIEDEYRDATVGAQESWVIVSKYI